MEAGISTKTPGDFHYNSLPSLPDGPRLRYHRGFPGFTYLQKKLSKLQYKFRVRPQEYRTVVRNVSVQVNTGDMVRQRSKHSRARVALSHRRCEIHDLRDIIKHHPQRSLVESDSSDSALSVINASSNLTKDPLALDKMQEPPTYYVMKMLAEMEAELTELEKASEINRSAAESHVSHMHEEVENMKNIILALEEGFSRTNIELKKAVDSARRVATLSIPNYILVLVNLVRRKIAGLLQEQSWDNLQQHGSSIDSLVRYIKQQFKQRDIHCSLSDDSLATVCNFHIDTLSVDNAAADHASQMWIREAIMDTPVECDSRQFLNDAYLFSYGASIEADELT
ncbi:hypothetical protein EDD16DRAFT_1524614 [Pisolithus croceorrhizus]|nr:hypothetical protein EDD16DRAFT_1524614 [Pisolithus croceorrhizus]